MRDITKKNVAGMQPFHLHNWNHRVDFLALGLSRVAAEPSPTLWRFCNETDRSSSGFGSGGHKRKRL
jgi:hypothetical protein